MSEGLNEAADISYRRCLAVVVVELLKPRHQSLRRGQTQPVDRRFFSRFDEPVASIDRILYSGVMARIVPFSEARARLTELLDDVETRHEHVVITRNGRPVAIVVSPEEWEALEETVEVLQDEELLTALRESEEDVKASRLFSLDEVKRELGLG